MSNSQAAKAAKASEAQKIADATKAVEVEEAAPTKPKRGRFLVPDSMYPGVNRHNVGFFVPGQVITLPDGATVVKDGMPVLVPSKLVPLDEESKEMLIESAVYIERMRAEAKARKSKEQHRRVAEIPEDAEDILEEAKEEARKNRSRKTKGHTVADIGKGL